MNDQPSNIFVPVILSGGMGTRLWPMSRGSYPKQFLALHSEEHCLIQETVLQLQGQPQFAKPVIVCNYEHRFLVAEKMRQINVMDADIILEPAQRNTAPAIAIAAHFVRDTYGDDACMLVLPSDHVIEDRAAFLTGTREAFTAAQHGHLATFGITPEYAHTGYGYMKLGTPLSDHANTWTVDQFVEKPDEATAEQYVDSGEYVWNSGMFCFQATTLLEELKTYQPQMTQAINRAANLRDESGDFITLDEQAFAAIPSQSIDYAVMEHTNKAVTVPLQCGWSDIGSWDALWRTKAEDADHNVIDGNAYTLDTERCYIACNDGVNIATLGVKDLVVVSTNDMVMIADKHRTQDIKDMVAKVRETAPQLVDNHRRVYRPWGYYEVLSQGPQSLTKRLVITPEASISDQLHHHRSEHWVVVSGTALVTHNDRTFTLTEHQSTYIPSCDRHRLENPVKIPLDITEVQSGSYLGEDDIIRFNDNYGRAQHLTFPQPSLVQ